MASSTQSPRLARLTGVLGFFIGIFGAMAILGVFFKILKLPHYELFMAIGFIGEAAAFVIMGVFALINSFTAKQYEDMPASSPQRQAEPLEVSPALKQALEKEVSAEVAKMIEALGSHVGRFSSEIEQVGGELERARDAIQTMRTELDRVASGGLAGDAERLGRGMQVLGGEMSEAGSAVERLRADLEEMATRFHHFNSVRPAPHAHDPTTEGKIKKMPWN